MKQLDKIKAVRRALEAADPEPSFLEPAADHKTVHSHGQYVCPFCGHGAHGDGLQAIKGSPAKWYCYGAGCKKDYDLIDLYKQRYGIADTAQAAEECAGALGVYVPEIEAEKDRTGSYSSGRDEPLNWQDEIAAQEAAVDFGPGTTEQQGQQTGQKGEAENQTTGKKSAPTETQQQRAPKLNDDENYNRDCRAYIDRCHAQAGQTDYFTRRGIPASLVERFKLGFDPSFPLSAPLNAEQKAKGLTPPYAWNTHDYGDTWQAVVIPLGDGSRFVARNTATPAGVTEKADKMNRYRYAKEPLPLFNPGALMGDKPVFIVEGQFDALSIMAAGGEALALGGSSKAELINLLKRNRPKFPVIIATDADKPGQDAAAALAKELEAPNGPGVKYIVANGLYGAYKDANEALLNDPAGFADRVRVWGKSVAEETDPFELESYYEEQQGYEAAHYAEQNDLTPRIRTGFIWLDQKLDGGLKANLYMIGAVSSLGKTTFAGQICDYVAEHEGRDVLIFSLEMGREDLIAKSISRLVAVERLSAFTSRHYQTGREPEREELAAMLNGTRGDIEVPKEKRSGFVTANEVSEGCKFTRLTDSEKAAVKRAEKRYFHFSKNRIFIFTGKHTIDDIKAKITRHIRLAKLKAEIEKRPALPPVVLVDYLQIIAAADNAKYTSDKNKIDSDISALANLTRDKHVPILCITSFNRGSYRDGARLDSMNGSSGIEYSADGVVTLQFSAIHYDGYDENDEKGKNPREVELVILKNRAGAGVGGKPLYFNYFPACNLYWETCIPPECVKKGDAEKKAENGSDADSLANGLGGNSTGNGINPLDFDRVFDELTIYQSKRPTVASMAKELNVKRDAVKAFLKMHPDIYQCKGGAITTTRKPAAPAEAEAETGKEAAPGADSAKREDIPDYDDGDGETAI